MNIRSLIPRQIRNLRHLWFAWYGAYKFRHPSRELLVIGITGTSGKSTTVFLLRQLLESAGYRVGSLSTIDFYIAGENKLNDQKMTMLGRYATQQYLREMVEKKCDIAIVETTSEGQLQYRNRYIAYDIMTLTNLYPEHIEAHGSFTKYKQAKLNIFQRAAAYNPRKKTRYTIPKSFVINGDLEQTLEFLQSGVAEKYVFGQKNKNVNGVVPVEHQYQLTETKTNQHGISGVLNNYILQAPMFGVHNMMNIAAAVTIARVLGIEWETVQEAVKDLRNAPGRTEFISEAEAHGFRVIVDYAFEPKAMNALYEVVDLIKPQRVIHVFGSTGGGRDVSRRFSVGELVGQRANVCIVTDEDPYDDDPYQIMNDVASAVRQTGKVDGSDLFVISDRREAITKAIQMADTGDLVLVTGKGSEQAMVVAGGRKIPWDDRRVVREELTKL